MRAAPRPLAPPPPPPPRSIRTMVSHGVEMCTRRAVVSSRAPHPGAGWRPLCKAIVKKRFFFAPFYFHTQACLCSSFFQLINLNAPYLRRCVPNQSCWRCLGVKKKKNAMFTSNELIFSRAKIKNAWERCITATIIVGLSLRGNAGGDWWFFKDWQGRIQRRVTREVSPASAMCLRVVFSRRAELNVNQWLAPEEQWGRENAFEKLLWKMCIWVKFDFNGMQKMWRRCPSNINIYSNLILVPVAGVFFQNFSSNKKWEEIKLV